MKSSFLIYVLILLVLRALFYYLPIRETIRKAILTYIVKSIIEIGLLFSLFEITLVPALAVPALLVLITLLSWSLETRLASHSSANAFVGLIISVVAVYFVFASSQSPVFRPFAATLFHAGTRRILLMAIAGIIALFELEHLVPGKVSFPGRFLL